MRFTPALSVFLLACVIFIGFIFLTAGDLPATVASHFNGAGKPNGWMDKNSYLLFMTLFGLGLPAFIIGLSYLTRFFPARFLNVPNAHYWRAPENFPLACRKILDWSVWLSATTVLWLTLLSYQLLSANQLDPPALDVMHVYVSTGVYVLLVAAFVIFLIISFRKTPSE